MNTNCCTAFNTHTHTLRTTVHNILITWRILCLWFIFNCTYCTRFVNVIHLFCIVLVLRPTRSLITIFFFTNIDPRINSNQFIQFLDICNYNLRNMLYWCSVIVLFNRHKDTCIRTQSQIIANLKKKNCRIVLVLRILHASQLTILHLSIEHI